MLLLLLLRNYSLIPEAFGQIRSEFLTIRGRPGTIKGREALESYKASRPLGQTEQ